MPYNLRKRKAPEPEPEPEPVEREPAPKKPAARKPAAKKPPAKKSAAKDDPEPTKEKIERKSVSKASKLAVKKTADKKPRAKKVVEKKVELEESGDESAQEEQNHKDVKDTFVVEKGVNDEKEPISEEEKEDRVKVEEELAEEKEPVEDKKKVEVRSGILMMHGEDSCGELGLKKIGFTKKKPIEVPVAEKIKQVACGPMHTLSLSESGLVYSHGCNDEGVLGRVTDGDEALDATPTTIKLKNKVTKITTGDSHGVALTDKQEVFVWGNFRDEHGLVGLTPECDGQHSYEPIQLLPKIKFMDIASGTNHVLLLDTKRNVHSFGVGEQGQLGRLSPEEIAEVQRAYVEISEAKADLEKAEEEKTDVTAAKERLDKAKTVMAEKKKLLLTPQVVDLQNVDPQRKFICDAVYAGNYSSFATNSDKKKNRLAAWGLNNYFQLGFKGSRGSTPQAIQHYPRRSTFTCSTSMIGVACGPHHTLFLTRTGRVYAAGRNEYGMLGVGTIKKQEVCPAEKVGDEFDEPISQICAGINISFAVDTAGKLFSWGMQGPALGVDCVADLKKPTQVTNLVDKEVLSVSAGGEFAAVIVK